MDEGEKGRPMVKTYFWLSCQQQQIKVRDAIMLCQRLVENRLLLYRPLFLLFHSHSSVFFSCRVFGAKFNRTTHSIHHVLLVNYSLVNLVLLRTVQPIVPSTFLETKKETPEAEPCSKKLLPIQIMFTETSL